MRHTCIFFTDDSNFFHIKIVLCWQLRLICKIVGKNLTIDFSTRVCVCDVRYYYYKTLNFVINYRINTEERYSDVDWLEINKVGSYIV